MFNAVAAVLFLGLFTLIISGGIFSYWDMVSYDMQVLASEIHASPIPAAKETVISLAIERLNQDTQRRDAPSRLPRNNDSSTHHISVDSSLVDYAVPFTAQAPFADWDDPYQQDGCEEASVTMAMHWVRGEPLDSKKALDTILSISEWEKEQWGFFEDASAADTILLFKEYFEYDQVRVEYDIVIDDIKQELKQGNIVIVPVAGHRLRNPYYTPPGPDRHMILIRGFDDKVQEFITNDPGTRRGNGFRYSYDTINNSLRDYPSGHSRPIFENRAVMVVVEK